MIRLRVYLPPIWNYDSIDKDGFISVPEGTTLKELLNILKIPVPVITVFLCRVNYEKAALSQRLNDGDIISFFFMVTGG